MIGNLGNTISGPAQRGPAPQQNTAQEYIKADIPVRAFLNMLCKICVVFHREWVPGVQKIVCRECLSLRRGAADGKGGDRRSC